MMDTSSLPAVARTCRALHDPALDELWRDLFSIYPFVHLLAEAMPGENQQASPISCSLSTPIYIMRYR